MSGVDLKNNNIDKAGDVADKDKKWKLPPIRGTATEKLT